MGKTMKKSTAKAFRKIKPKSGKRGPNMSEEIKRTIRRLYYDGRGEGQKGIISWRAKPPAPP